MSGQWAGSNRTTELPPHWRTTIRPAVLTRDNHQCTWLDDHDDGGYPNYLAGDYHPHQRCPEHGEPMQVDHVGDKHNHSIDNARTLCPWHHGRRSSQQGNAAQRRPTTRRPREPHPGLLPPADPAPF